MKRFKKYPPNVRASPQSLFLPFDVYGRAWTNLSIRGERSTGSWSDNTAWERPFDRFCHSLLYKNWSIFHVLRDTSCFITPRSAICKFTLLSKLVEIFHSPIDAQIYRKYTNWTWSRRILAMSHTRQRHSRPHWKLKNRVAAVVYSPSVALIPDKLQPRFGRKSNSTYLSVGIMSSTFMYHGW